jgi:dTDP-4-amino-4,6-dideoxygalactose transaminase
MDAIMAVAREHDLRVIEDCAQAHGARYRGQCVGTIGEISVFSLNANKSIQVGEGGICLTRDADLRYRLALIRNHGEAVVEEAGYDQLTNIVGFNFRLTEIAAAMAIEQLKKLERLTELRRAYVQALSERVGAAPFLIPPPACSHAAFGDAGCQTCRSTYYVYPMRFQSARCGVRRDEFVRLVRAEGIRLVEGYIRPLYLQPLYQTKQAFKQGYPFAAPVNQAIRTNYERGACPVAERLYAEEMLINEHVRPPHSLDDVMDIARAIQKIAAAITVSPAPAERARG